MKNSWELRIHKSFANTSLFVKVFHKPCSEREGDAMRITTAGETILLGGREQTCRWCNEPIPEKLRERGRRLYNINDLLEG